MQFDSLEALWSMNGHGPYVWSAYGLAAIILLAIVWVPLRRRRRFFIEQRGIERRRDIRGHAASGARSQAEVVRGEPKAAISGAKIH